MQGVVGLGQLTAGLLIKPRRPKYKIPGAIGEATSAARSLASNSIRPGDAQALANIRQSTSNSIDTVKGVSSNAAQILNAVNRINVNEQNALRGNSALNSEFSMWAKQQLPQQLNVLAGYQDKEFQINKFEPYMRKAELKSALIGGGLQNMYNGAQSMSFMSAFGGGGNGGGSMVASGLRR